MPKLNVQKAKEKGYTDEQIQALQQQLSQAYEKPPQKKEKKYFGKGANTIVGGDVLPSLGRFLGMEQFGQGLSALLPESITGVDKAREAQVGEQQAINNLPPETLRRMAREGKTIQSSGSIKDLTSASTHDLTNTQVLGSAVATGANLVGGVGMGSARGLLGKSLISGGTGAVTGGAVTAAEGGDAGDIAKGAAISGVIGGSLPGMGALSKKGFSKLGNVLGEATELLGIPKEAAKTAFNPGDKAGRKAFDAARKGKINGEDILETAEDAFRKYADDIRVEYRSDLAAIPGGSSRRITKNDVVTKVQEILKDPSHKVNITKDGLDFSQSSIADAGEVAKLNEMYKDLTGWKNNTVLGMDTLKKRLSDGVNKLKGSKEAFVLAQEMRNAVGDKLKSESDEYSKLVANYDQAIDTANEIASNLKLGRGKGKGDPQMALNKVIKALDSNRDFSAKMLGTLDEKATANLRQYVSGMKYQPLVAQGLNRQLQVGAGLGAVGGMMAGIPGIQGPALAGLIGLSPRIQGMALRNAGRLSRPMGAAAGQAGKLPPSVTGVLSGLLTPRQ